MKRSHPVWIFLFFLSGIASFAASTSEPITVGPVSASSSAHGFSAAAEISADGRYVLFESAASDLTSPGLPGGIVNLYVRDRQTGHTHLVSRNLTGTGGGNEASTDGAFSTDMRWIAFESRANNLSAGDDDDAVDIFLHDRVGSPGTELEFAL